jgi:acetolactate synthase I/II/III large subunit
MDRPALRTMTGGEAIADSLIAHGVDTVFGIPGIQMDNLFDAFYHRGNALRVIHTRHEQGAAYMAMGYAQSTGRSAVYAVVPGPGFLNSLTALADAQAANLPVFALTGQIPSSKIGGGMGMPHELKDQQMVARGVVDWVVRANHPSEAPALIGSAFQHMQSGRPCPAVFEMAPDIMGQSSPVELRAPLDLSRPPEPDPAKVVRIADLIHKSRNPIINIGGGAVDAGEEVLILAELIGAPIVMTPNARGIVPDDHPRAYHMLEGQELWESADLVIAIGTRFSTPGLAWGRPELPVVRIDIDPVQATKPKPAALMLITSAALGASVLAKALSGHQPAERSDDPAAVKAALKAKLDSLEPVAGFAKAIRAALPRDAIIVSDITQFGVYARFGLPVYAPRSYLLPGYQATLGWAYPAALGAQVGNPRKKVIAFAGDGGFLFNVQELATAAQHNIPVVVIVFDNGTFGNVKLIQKKNYGGRHIATELQNPDFVMLGRSFGVSSAQATTAAELQSALEGMLDAGKPGLIHVPVGDLPDVWALIKRPPSQG